MANLLKRLPDSGEDCNGGRDMVIWRSRDRSKRSIVPERLLEVDQHPEEVNTEASSSSRNTGLHESARRFVSGKISP